MSPIIALILCIAFVIFLLFLEHRQYPDASITLWIPTLWFLLATSKPVGIWFGIGGISMEEGSPLDRIVLVILLFLAFAVLLKKNFDWLKTFTENPWVFLLLSITLISILWSDMPLVSLKRWIKTLIPIFMACVVAVENKPFKAVQGILRRTIYIHVPFSLLLIKYYPKLGVQYARWSGELMWIGVSTQKNGLAFLCLLTLLYFVWIFLRRLRNQDAPVIRHQIFAEILVFILATWLFLGPNHTFAYSATSTATLIVGIMSLIILSRLRRKNILVNKNLSTLLFLILILYGTTTPFAGGFLLYDPSHALGRESTLTGRTDIWRYLAPFALSKPFLGHGFGGFWTDVMRETTSSHAHNGYLDIILNNGFLGLFLVGGFLLANCRSAINLMAANFYWGVFWFCLTLAAVVHNIAESTIVGFDSEMMALLLFFYFAANGESSKRVAK